jgi:segregation and condensation protein A
MEDKPISLRKLLANTHSQQALICMFLALLEMVRLQAVMLRQTNVGGDILIKKSDNFDDVIADHSAIVRDDWR